MGTFIKKTIYFITIYHVIFYISGCGTPAGVEAADDLGTTIGSLVDVIYPESIPVEGFGLVGGLRGTGSSECPPQIRTYLTRYIMAQLPAETISKTQSLIDSLDTAVVLIESVMPVQQAKGTYFDVRVTALPGTQTTSLEGGWLYRAELKIESSFGITTDILADAEGPVYIDKINSAVPDKRTGYILAGGKNLTQYKIGLALDRTEFRLTNVIRNRLNERFGPDTARAVSPGQIEITIPARYQENRKRFVSIIKALYLTQTPETTQKRISHFARQLALLPESGDSEITLEAIGNQSLVELGILLNASDERVRLCAARCMLNLGTNAGLPILRGIVMDGRSERYRRLEAQEAIFAAARPNDAISLARELLNDDDFNVRLAAYEHLRKSDDMTVTREALGRSFFLEQIVRSRDKMIYITRSNQPRIVLFGAPIYCNRGIFIQSSDGEITINAPVDQNYVSIIRAHPKRPNVIAQVKTSFDLGDIIRILCMEPAVQQEKGPGGLGVSYSEMILLLKQMCDKGAVNAEFRAGPMPKIGLNIKK